MATKEGSLPLNEVSGVSATCSPCLEAGKTTEANRYCVECTSYLCEQCLQDHNKFAALRKHHIVDKSEAAEYPEETDQSKGNVRVECGSHYGQYIDSYCKDHDEVCCSVCMTIKHRPCMQTEKILKVAKGIRESKEFSNTRDSLEQFLVFADQEKADRNENLTSLDEQKTQILSDIDEFEENIIKRIKVIAGTSREDIRTAHTKHVNAVKSDVKALDTVMSGLKESLNQLNKTEVNETEAFVSTKNCQKTLAEVKVVMNDLSDKWLQTELYYKFNSTILRDHITALGDVTEEKKNDRVCRFTRKRNVNISNKTDNSQCRINGICQLADGTFVIIDSNNINIKRLTDNLEVTHNKKLKGPPDSICATGSKEVAITLPGKNLIQFVKVDERLSLGPSFSTAPGSCTVINYDSTEDKLYVSCKNVKTENNHEQKYSTISAYNKKGILLTTFEKDSEGQTFLTEPHQIFLEAGRILVLDEQLKTVVLEKTADGQLAHTRQKLPSFSWQRDWCKRKCICLLSKNVMLSKRHYEGLSLYSMEEGQIKTIEMENSSEVLTAVFNQQRSTLIVAGEFCDIREYKVPQKILKLLK